MTTYSNGDDKSEGIEEENHDVHNPFDSLFKVFMSDVHNARDFMAMHLPPDIIQHIDLSKLLLCPQTFVDNKLKHKHIDVLYQTTFDDKIGYVYLLTEQQTEADKDMPFRIMQYVLRIIEHHKKQFNTDIFPVIYPLVFYVGKAPYRYSTDFYDGFGDNKELAKSILTHPFRVAHVVGATQEELHQHPLAGTLSMVYQLAFARDITNKLIALQPQFLYIDMHVGSNLILAMLKFILSRAEYGNANRIIETVAQMVTKTTGDAVMTLSQQLKQEGIQQGIQQEKLMIAKSMLLDKMPIETISKYTTLTVDEINKLKKELKPTTH